MGTIILENMIPLVVTALTPVILMLVHGLMQAITKKWHLEDAMKYEGKVDALVLKGIKAAEKKSMNAIKGGGEKTSNEEKLSSTLAYVNTTLRSHGLPEKGGKELAIIIESMLFDGAKEKLKPAEITE